MPPLLRLLRPQQWIKNVFVLAGVFFAFDAADTGAFWRAGLAFAAFCLASGAVYALNDVLDREADALHPRKRTRPVASGAVPVGAALALAAACGVAALSLSAQAGRPLFALTALYLLVNLAYSRWLKHVVLADVFCIASGFLLRLLAGTTGIGIPPSKWFMLCTFLLSLFLAFSKRYAERMDAGQAAEDKRAVVEDYPPELLRVLLGVTLACTLMTYSLYTLSAETLAVHGTARLAYTVPLAAFVLFRYLWLVMARGFGENLAGELFRDRAMLAAMLAYAAVTVAVLLG